MDFGDLFLNVVVVLSKDLLLALDALFFHLLRGFDVDGVDDFIKEDELTKGGVHACDFEVCFEVELLDAFEALVHVLLDSERFFGLGKDVEEVVV